MVGAVAAEVDIGTQTHGCDKWSTEAFPFGGTRSVLYSIFHVYKT